MSNLNKQLAEMDAFEKAHHKGQKKSRGLGDTIAKVTKAVGLRPCGGCRKRQATLNKLLPYS